MALLASDTFTRANETPLASPWLRVSFSSPTFNLVSNAVVANSLSLDTAYYYSGVTWPADQYAQAKISVTGTSLDTGYGVLLRGVAFSTGVTTYYRAVVNKNGGGSVAVQKIVSGAFTSLATRSTTWVNGDVLRLEVQGSTLRVYKNGTQLGADISDSSIATGNAGIAYSSTVTGGGIDDWEGGPLGALLQLKDSTGNLFTTPSASKLQVQ